MTKTIVKFVANNDNASEYKSIIVDGNEMPTLISSLSDEKLIGLIEDIYLKSVHSLDNLIKATANHIIEENRYVLRIDLEKLYNRTYYDHAIKKNTNFLDLVREAKYRNLTEHLSRIFDKKYFNNVS